MAMHCKSIPVDYIKERANIIDYISKFYPDIKLRRSGTVFITKCPFHNEETGSLAIWNNGTYKCFGCAEHGDVIKFVQKIENLGFKEACKLVAQNVGVEYVLEKPNPAHEQYKDMMNAHNRRYWKALKNEPLAMNYLRETRGLSDEVLDSFRVGYVPMDEYKTRSDMGGISGRIAFPILEHKSLAEAKCVAMGYRTLNESVKPKYVNDKNKDEEGTPLCGVYVKGNFLYGYSHAYQSIRKHNMAIVTEGYIDVLSMHQAGLTNVVAPLGTALTERQADILKTLTDNLVLFLDGDKAGISNMVRVLPMLLQKGFNVKMMVAENQMDAADLCKSLDFNGSSVAMAINKKSVQAVQYIIDTASADYERTVVEARRKAMHQVSGILTSITNEIDKDLYKSLLYKKLDV